MESQRHAVAVLGWVLHPRLALGMATFAALGWYTSSYRPLLGSEYPNCVAACYKNDRLGFGFVSIGGVSCLFVERDPTDSDRLYWGERPDGHFCTFFTPIGAEPGWELEGFAVRIRSDAIAWCCPYWLITLFWGCVVSLRLRRFSIADGIAVMTCAATFLALSGSRVLLPLLVPVNLLTVIAVLAAAGSKPRRPAAHGEPLKAANEP